MPGKKGNTVLLLDCNVGRKSTLSPLLSFVPLGAHGGPGKESQSSRRKTSWLQSALHTLTLLSPLVASHNHTLSTSREDSWNSVYSEYNNIHSHQGGFP